jgi:hypothetical protein
MSSFLIKLHFFKLSTVRIPVPCTIVAPTDATAPFPFLTPPVVGEAVD